MLVSAEFIACTSIADPISETLNLAQFYQINDDTFMQRELIKMARLGD
jgi:hypothetical protein